MNVISANFTKGNSYWKFNNSLLNDIECVRRIKETIKRDKLQYASNIQLNNKSPKENWAEWNNNLIRLKFNPNYCMYNYTYMRQIYQEC